MATLKRSLLRNLFAWANRFLSKYFLMIISYRETGDDIYYVDVVHKKKYFDIDGETKYVQLKEANEQRENWIRDFH